MKNKKEKNSLIIINGNSVDDKYKKDYRFKIVYALAMMSVIADHCRGKGSIEFNIQGWFNYSSYLNNSYIFI